MNTKQSAILLAGVSSLLAALGYMENELPFAMAATVAALVFFAVSTKKPM